MSPKTKEQFEVIRQRSMAAIKEAALELFAHHGFYSTSISRIAKEAGVSKGLMYNYFKSKDDLLQSIIMDAMAIGEKLMTKYLNESEDPFEQLRGLTEGAFAMVKGNLHYWKLLTSLAFQADVLEGMGSILKKKEKEAFGMLIDIFTRMGVKNPEFEAFAFGALLDGVVIHFMQMEEDYPLDEMQDYILEKYKGT